MYLKFGTYFPAKEWETFLLLHEYKCWLIIY